MVRCFRVVVVLFTSSILFLDLQVMSPSMFDIETEVVTSIDRDAIIAAVFEERFTGTIGDPASLSTLRSPLARSTPITNTASTTREHTVIPQQSDGELSVDSCSRSISDSLGDSSRQNPTQIDGQLDFIMEKLTQCFISNSRLDPSKHSVFFLFYYYKLFSGEHLALVIAGYAIDHRETQRALFAIRDLLSDLKTMVQHSTMTRTTGKVHPDDSPALPLPVKNIVELQEVNKILKTNDSIRFLLVSADFRAFRPFS